MRFYVFVDIRGTACGQASYKRHEMTLTAGLGVNMTGAEKKEDNLPANQLLAHLSKLMIDADHDLVDYYGTGQSTVVIIPFGSEVETKWLEQPPMPTGGIVGMQLPRMSKRRATVSEFAVEKAIQASIAHHLEQDDDHGYRCVFILPYLLPNRPFSFDVPIIAKTPYKPEFDLLMTDQRQVLARKQVKDRFRHTMSSQSSLDDFRDWISPGRRTKPIVQPPPKQIVQPPPRELISPPIRALPIPAKFPGDSRPTLRQVVRAYLVERKRLHPTDEDNRALAQLTLYQESGDYFKFLDSAYSNIHFAEDSNDVIETLANALQQALDSQTGAAFWHRTNSAARPPSPPPNGVVTTAGLASLAQVLSQAAYQVPVDLGVRELVGGDGLRGPQLMHGASRAHPAAIVAKDGLGLEILSGVVRLRHLLIDAGNTGIAIRVHPRAQLITEHVLIRGRVEGIAGEDGTWTLPDQIDLQDVPARATSRHLIPVSLPVPCTLTSEIDGLVATLVGQTAIEVVLAGERDGTVLHGYLLLHSERFVRRLQISGRFSSTVATSQAVNTNQASFSVLGTPPAMVVTSPSESICDRLITLATSDGALAESRRLPLSVADLACSLTPPPGMEMAAWANEVGSVITTHISNHKDLAKVWVQIAPGCFTIKEASESKEDVLAEMADVIAGLEAGKSLTAKAIKTADVGQLGGEQPQPTTPIAQSLVPVTDITTSETDPLLLSLTLNLKLAGSQRGQEWLRSLSPEERNALDHPSQQWPANLLAKVQSLEMSTTTTSSSPTPVATRTSPPAPITQALVPKPPTSPSVEVLIEECGHLWEQINQNLLCRRCAVIRHHWDGGACSGNMIQEHGHHWVMRPDGLLRCGGCLTIRDRWIAEDCREACDNMLGDHPLPDESRTPTARIPCPLVVVPLEERKHLWCAARLKCKNCGTSRQSWRGKSCSELPAVENGHHWRSGHNGRLKCVICRAERMEWIRDLGLAACGVKPVQPAPAPSSPPLKPPDSLDVTSTPGLETQSPEWIRWVVFFGLSILFCVLVILIANRK